MQEYVSSAPKDDMSTRYASRPSKEEGGLRRWCRGNGKIEADENRLINEASIKSKQAGERGVSARSVRKVSERTLRKYKG